MDIIFNFIYEHWNQIRIICGCLFGAFIITACIIEHLDDDNQNKDNFEDLKW